MKNRYPSSLFPFSNCHRTAILSAILISSLFITQNASADSEDEENALEGTDELQGIFVNVVGYESNIFELNYQQENPTGAWYQDSSLQIENPFQTGNANLAATLNASVKTYFGQSQINEYILKPGLTWHVIDSETETLNLDVRASRFQERIYNENLQNAPNRSERGWSIGAGGKWEKDVLDQWQLTWTSGSDLQLFDNAFLNNLKITTKTNFEREIVTNLKWSLGSQFEYQSYRNRPIDSESAINPSGLNTLESRGFTGWSYEFGRTWVAELEVNGGYNSDLTNGFYNANVLGARMELRWESTPWKIKVSGEPEWLSFSNRRANLEVANHTLSTQEYNFDIRVDYQWSERLGIFCQGTGHFQQTNSDLSRGDAALNKFGNQIISTGISVLF